LAIATFRKLGDNAMNGFNANQILLLKAVFSVRPLKKYETLFSFFDTSALKILYPSTGRPPIPYEALLEALIYKNIKCTSFASILVYFFYPINGAYVSELIHPKHFALTSFLKLQFEPYFNCLEYFSLS
jgi:hypothetical protein